MVNMQSVMHNTQMRVSTPTDVTYSELQQAYEHFNRELFTSRLPSCLFTLQRQKRTFGYFSRERFGRRDGGKTDEIAINPEYFASVSVVEVMQTLVHEMVHLWQHHFGTPSRACYHNREWADRMESIGLMPSSTGQPGGRRVGQHMSDYVLPGGRFDQVTNQLIKDGFGITWYDRYPAPPPTHPAAAGIREIGSKAGTADALRPVRPGGAGILPASAYEAPSTTVAHLFASMKTGNRSNRVKYTCPRCAANAWGKPNLNLVCGDCNVPFSAGHEQADQG